MFLVVEPAEVNTVSNKTESCEKVSFAAGSVNNLSFLQEVLIQRKKQNIPIMKAAFFKLSNVMNITVNREV